MVATEFGQFDPGIQRIKDRYATPDLSRATKVSRDTERSAYCLMQKTRSAPRRG